MKSHSLFNRQSYDTLKQTVLCLDAKDATRALTCSKMFMEHAQDEKLWQQLALRDVSVSPKKLATESFYHYYRRAHRLLSEAKNEDSKAKLNDIFMKIVLGGFDKYANQLIDRVNLNSVFRTGILVDYPVKSFSYGFLHMAAWVGNSELTNLFIDKGINVNISFYRPIELAANVFVNKERGPTPLMLAAAGGHDDIVELFISKGADLNYKSQHPILTAGGGPQPVLLIAGFDEFSALDLAKRNNHIACVALLRSHGALPTSTKHGSSSYCVVM